MPQCARTFKVNCCLKIHNAHLKLLSPISGYALGKQEAQTLGGGGGSVIDSFALGSVFLELEPFCQFFIMAGINFPFQSTLGKLG